MLRSDFHFDLPAAQIAQHPAANRGASRLMCLNLADGACFDRQFTDLPRYLRAGDVLILNNTRVLAARLYGHKTSGGKVELLIERVQPDHQVLAFVRASKSPKPGSEIVLEDGSQVRVLEKNDALFRLQFSDDPYQVMQRIGHMPLPPYIQREDQAVDRERYQTVYADQPGSAAAPTAGLHFDQAMLQRLQAQGVQSAFVTLHVGAGTFSPIRAERIEQHRMHQEWIEVPQATCDLVNQAKAEGRRIVAIGSTSVRCLETAARQGELHPYSGNTDIFIYPPYAFQIVDAMLTNFHLPESSLLIMVCAFAGKTAVLNAYQHAVEQGYRFFSYGDAMFIAALSDTERQP